MITLAFRTLLSITSVQSCKIIHEGFHRKLLQDSKVYYYGFTKSLRVYLLGRSTQYISIILSESLLLVIFRKLHFLKIHLYIRFFGPCILCNIQFLKQDYSTERKGKKNGRVGKPFAWVQHQRS